jgi:methylglutaconyl-CoA hydratase
VPAEYLDDTVHNVLKMLAKAGPVAQHEAKRLAFGMHGLTEDAVERIDHDNAALIARLRVSAEGQEGLSAFLDKRAAAWTHDH